MSSVKSFRTANQPSAVLLTVLAVAGRLLPHPPNFAPVTGATLFGSHQLSRPLNYLLPIVIMFLSDLVLGFHNTMFYVYASFLFIAWLGEKALKERSWLKLGAVSLISSLVFFLVTNFGVWLAGGLYPLTLAGLLRCYELAIPFFSPTLAGDLIYTYGFFGLYALVANRQVISRFDNLATDWFSKLTHASR